MFPPSLFFLSGKNLSLLCLSASQPPPIRAARPDTGSGGVRIRSCTTTARPRQGAKAGPLDADNHRKGCAIGHRVVKNAILRPKKGVHLPGRRLFNEGKTAILADRPVAIQTALAVNRGGTCCRYHGPGATLYPQTGGQIRHGGQAPPCHTTRHESYLSQKGGKMFAASQGRFIMRSCGTRACQDRYFS